MSTQYKFLANSLRPDLLRDYPGRIYKETEVFACLHTVVTSACDYIQSGRLQTDLRYMFSKHLLFNKEYAFVVYYHMYIL